MTTHALGPREILGRIAGAIAAPVFAAISALRHARTFHPRGLIFAGHAVPFSSVASEPIARHFGGHVLARFSGALAKRDTETSEVLGLALRFSDDPITSITPHEGDQDVLFATILTPLAMPISPMLTRSDDFLDNHYHAVAPFLIEGRRVKLRVSPLARTHERHETRRARLTRAVAEERAVLVIEMRETLTARWEPLAKLVLDRELTLDQEALRFDPFHTGRDVEPVGFVHGLRRAVYAASQWARPPKTA